MPLYPSKGLAERSSSSLGWFLKNSSSSDVGRFLGKSEFFRNARVTPAPARQNYEQNSGQNMTPKMLQNKAKSTVLRPYFCPWFCLVCGGWGFKMIPHKISVRLGLGALLVWRCGVADLLGRLNSRFWEHFARNGELAPPHRGCMLGNTRKSPKRVQNKLWKDTPVQRTFYSPRDSATLRIFFGVPKNECFW